MFKTALGEMVHATINQPLQGIIAQMTESAVIYDADTTQGGSGGPVFNLKGEVVAVNAAIVPGYTGSNIGVPIDFVWRLVDQADINLGE